MMSRYAAAVVVLILVSTVGFASPTTHYVDSQSSNPTPPYTTWATAAQTIQDAVDAAAEGDTVLLTNGTYDIGGRLQGLPVPPAETPPDGSWGRRVVIDKALTLTSVNGPNTTIIRGDWINNIGGIAATSGVVIAGVSVTGGGTASGAQAPFDGAGILCEGDVVITNCHIYDNQLTARSGAGVWGGRLFDSTLANNHAWQTGFGGGAASSSLVRCTIVSNSASSGGGIALSVATHCVFRGNDANNEGGGATQSAVDNSLFVGNISHEDGAAAARGNLNNCTVYSNYAGSGGAGYVAVFSNCIVYANRNGLDGNGNWVDYRAVACYFADPQFVDAAGGNFRLLSASPCVDAGINGAATSPIDMDGNPRILNGAVDIGCYEFASPEVSDEDADGIPAWWETWYFGSPTNCLPDQDSDGDGMNDWAEWRAGTDPTNANSRFLLAPMRLGTNAAIVIRWPSISNRFYAVESLGEMTSNTFATLARDIRATPPLNTYTDTSHSADMRMFYRIRVED